MVIRTQLTRISFLLILSFSSVGLLHPKNTQKLSKTQKNKHLELAEIYFSSGNYTSALNEYNLLINQKWPKKTYLELLSKKALSHENLKQYDHALESFQKCIELDPKNWQHHLNIANVYEKANINSQAVLEYKKVIELNGDKFSAYYGLGRIHQLLGLNSQAAENFKQALLIKSTADIYRRLSICYETMRKWEIASDILKQAISLESVTEDYVRLALIYSFQNKFKDVIEYLRIAGDKAPDRVDIKFHLVAAYFKKGDYESAKNLLNALSEMNQEDALAHFLLGFICYFQGDISSSKVEISKALTLAKTPILKEYSELFLSIIQEKVSSQKK